MNRTNAISIPPKRLRKRFRVRKTDFSGWRREKNGASEGERGKVRQKTGERPEGRQGKSSGGDRQAGRRAGEIQGPATKNREDVSVLPISVVCRAGVQILLPSSLLQGRGSNSRPPPCRAGILNLPPPLQGRDPESPPRGITCGRSSCSRRSPRRRAPPRCGAAGCTWPYGPNATSSRS